MSSNSDNASRIFDEPQTNTARLNDEMQSNRGVALAHFLDGKTAVATNHIELADAARMPSASATNEAISDLRAYLGRLLGWKDTTRVEQALHSLEAAAAHKAQLILCGTGDLAPIAFGLHRRAFGATPFVLCDPRRRDGAASVRSPANFTDIEAAFSAASGGSLCIRRHRRPRDFHRIARRLRDSQDVHYILLEDVAPEWLVRPGPIDIPPLSARLDDVPRIIEEVMFDALTEMTFAHPLDAGDIAWLAREAAVSSLAEVEKATRRFLALRNSATITQAAARLDMAAVSLTRWIDRREVPPGLRYGHGQQHAAA